MSTQPVGPFDVVIVGGGIVGLATAHRLLVDRPGLELALCEKEDTLGFHQTGHNSGVVHSGLYYRPGSEKAATCVRGAAAMLAFCREHAIPHAVCGKVVVATTARELPRLDELERRGHRNGVPGLRRVGPDELAELEPHARGIAALHVPGAAIVDYRAVARTLGELVQRAGGVISTGTRVVSIQRDGSGFVLRARRTHRAASQRDAVSPDAVSPDAEPRDVTLRCRRLVTCAGLQSDRVTRAATGREPARIVPFRGDYYQLVPERAHLVRGMVYPVPDPRFPFLGVHFTRTVDGGVEAGPNAVLALRREGYHKLAFGLRDAFDTLRYPGFWRLAVRHFATGAAEVWRSFSKRAFTRALQRLVPDIHHGDLRRGPCGVRAQAVARDGALVDDFLLVEEPNALHVCNAPSPAATASLAIAEAIAARLHDAARQNDRHVGGTGGTETKKRSVSEAR